MTIDEMIVEKFGVKDISSLPFRATVGTREELAQLFGELGYKSGAEIGVRGGHYSLRLCRNIPGLKIKCVDPWNSFRRNSQRKMDAYFENTRIRMEPYNAEIIRKTSMEASKDIPDGSLDFVYIDAMHEFDSVMMDIILWSPKVRKEGMVSGHDYTPDDRFCGVVSAVEAYTKVHNIGKYYITIGDHKWEKAVPSFFWVKK